MSYIIISNAIKIFQNTCASSVLKKKLKLKKNEFKDIDRQAMAVFK